MSTDQDRLHIQYLQKRDQLFAWLGENKEMIVRMALFGEVPDEEGVYNDIGLLLVEALVRHTDDVHTEDATEDLRGTLRWLVADVNFRREQTGLDGDPLSPEMELAQKLLKELEEGKVTCRRIP